MYDHKSRCIFQCCFSKPGTKCKYVKLSYIVEEEHVVEAEEPRSEKIVVLDV